MFNAAQHASSCLCASQIGFALSRRLSYILPAMVVIVLTPVLLAADDLEDAYEDYYEERQDRYEEREEAYEDYYGDYEYESEDEAERHFGENEWYGYDSGYYGDNFYNPRRNNYRYHRGVYPYRPRRNYESYGYTPWGYRSYSPHFQPYRPRRGYHYYTYEWYD